MTEPVSANEQQAMEGNIERYLSIGERRYETEQLIKRLTNTQEGEFISYEELTRLSGINVQIDRGPLHTAREVTERELKCIWSVVYGKGIRRLSPEDSVAEVASVRKKIHKAARRALNRTDCVQYDRLSGESKIELNAARTIYQFTKLSTSQKSKARIEKAVSEQNHGLELNYSATLELFRNGTKR